MATKAKGKKVVEDDDEDLIGDTTAKSPKAAAKAAKVVAKAAKAKAKSAKVATKPVKKIATKPAKKISKKKNGERVAKGDGKYFFPQEERDALALKVAKQVKKKTTAKEVAAAMKLPIWKVRLAAKTAGKDKKLHISRSGKDGGGLIVLAPR